MCIEQAAKHRFAAHPVSIRQALDSVFVKRGEIRNLSGKITRRNQDLGCESITESLDSLVFRRQGIHVGIVDDSNCADLKQQVSKLMMQRENLPRLGVGVIKIDEGKFIVHQTEA
jgi:hypothetical protein